MNIPGLVKHSNTVLLELTLDVEAKIIQDKYSPFDLRSLPNFKEEKNRKQSSDHRGATKHHHLSKLQVSCVCNQSNSN